MIQGPRPFDALGEVLRELRRERRLSEEELARRCGMPQKTLSAIERGEEEPTLEALGRVLDGLEVGVRQLGHRLDEARRRARGEPEPPEELQAIVGELGEGLWMMLWYRWRRESDYAVSEPPEGLRRSAAEAAGVFVEEMWRAFHAVAEGVDVVRSGEAGEEAEAR